MEPYLDKAPCLYFVTTDDGTVQSVNAAFCRHMGYSAAELQGKRCDVFFPLATRIFQQTHLFPMLRMQGHADEIFLHLRPRTGEDLPVLINAERSGDPALTHYACIIVRHRKEFEDELIAARNTAEAALNENTALQDAKRDLLKHADELEQQMERVRLQNFELRQFNRVVTHDVQEPLRKLQVFTNMALEDGAQQQKVLEKVHRITGELRDIISGLHQYVWLSDAPLRKDVIDLEPMLRAAAARAESQFPGVRLHLQVNGSACFTADREQVLWLVYELLYNAARFRRQPDAVTVQVSADTVQQNRYRNVEGRYEYAEFLRLRFTDDGLGFEPAYGEQALELFRRLHPGSGRGIGLALCRKIMDHHRGSIRLDSQPGTGTTVTLLFAPDTSFECSDALNPNLQKIQHEP